MTTSTSTPSPYRVCTRCIMDTSDVEIRFNDEGVCNHCIRHQRQMRAFLKKGPDAEAALASLVKRVQEGTGKQKYNCIIGLSGGVDSSYVAYVVKKVGLKPLAVHLDNGWNSTEAVSNIKRIVSELDIDLYTEVLDWEEFRDLQLAFLRASTPDSEIPTDHAIWALMMSSAVRWGVRHIIIGRNLQSEGILPRTWSRGHNDWKYIKNVHKRFGTVPLKTFPHYSVVRHIHYRKVIRLQSTDILNLVEYDREDAKDILKREVGWQDYGGKHHESIYTRFFQAYILPTKFGIDKRRAHFSNLISSGYMTREQALGRMSSPPCQPELMCTDKRFVAKKLGITETELDQILAAPPKTIYDYPSHERSRLYAFGRTIYQRLNGTAVDRLPEL